MLQSTKNFETIEDPVEYFLEDANQVYVRDKIGLSFASVLRSTLRQDPDVILVGEIRDIDTADVVFKAGLTGHMVLSSLHTNNTVASITRLIDIGVKPYLIASSLEGIIAQRLVRKICPSCKVEAEPDPGVMKLLNLPPETLTGKVALGTGCRQCNNTGYLGRTGIFEVFTMNDDFRHSISTGYREAELFNAAIVLGMRTLMQDSLEKVKHGETTLEEILRVLGPQTRIMSSCTNCGQTIDARFLYCPFCGIFKHNICQQCKTPLESDWVRCPHCGWKRSEVS
jgi:type II secretory ATPase GspE/PulE/Tfp pilus assembly ATPase PilB-like protein